MPNIIIYTTGDKLLHKQGKLPDDDDYAESGYYYWSLKRHPKKLDESDTRIYFAVKGYIRGYFEISDVGLNDCDIEFDSDSWKDIEPIPCKPFQGFKYADKVEGLE